MVLGTLGAGWVSYPLVDREILLYLQQLLQQMAVPRNGPSIELDPEWDEKQIRERELLKPLPPGSLYAERHAPNRLTGTSVHGRPVTIPQY
jgi:hypothetical protein